jgi:flavin-dependent dehydrogenase
VVDQSPEASGDQVQADVDIDVVIIGGGPGGSTTSLFLEKLGLSSVIVEADPFPRFHIGESMTGEAGAILRRLGLEETMIEMAWPVKHATEVYGAGGQNKFRVPVMARESNGLKAASTWQVRRSEFDTMLLDRAIERGATLVRGEAVDPILARNGAVTGTTVRLEDRSTTEIAARMVVDASGRGTWASRAGLTGERKRGNYATQTAVFSHVRNAVRDDGDDCGNTLIFYSSHLHWGWFIPIDNEITSIGIVAPNSYFREFSSDVDGYFAGQLESLNPELKRRIEDAEHVEPVRATANFSYEIPEYVGDGFLCVGDSHRFIDPIFSFGLYISMAEAERAAGAIAEAINNLNPAALNDYLSFADRGQETLQHLVDGFWANPLAFGYMVHHSDYAEDFVDMFAGRIYSEKRSAAYEKLGQLIKNAT